MGSGMGALEEGRVRWTKRPQPPRVEVSCANTTAFPVCVRKLGVEVAAGDQPQCWHAEILGAVDRLSGEPALGVVAHRVDGERRHDAVGPGDLDLGSRLELSPSSKNTDGPDSVSTCPSMMEGPGCPGVGDRSNQAALSRSGPGWGTARVPSLARPIGLIVDRTAIEGIEMLIGLEARSGLAGDARGAVAEGDGTGALGAGGSI